MVSQTCFGQCEGEETYIDSGASHGAVLMQADGCLVGVADPVELGAVTGRRDLRIVDILEGCHSAEALKQGMDALADTLGVKLAGQASVFGADRELTAVLRRWALAASAVVGIVRDEAGGKAPFSVKQVEEVGGVREGIGEDKDHKILLVATDGLNAEAAILDNVLLVARL